MKNGGVATPPAGARIGPNAITQLAHALTDRLGPRQAYALFESADLAAWFSASPENMVDEDRVIRLHRVVHARLDAALATAVTRDAGWRTADYLLANRIPRPVQRLLSALPSGLASRILVSTIARHSWTFAGSGRFRVQSGRPLTLCIANCPLCRGAVGSGPLCDYYAGTFEGLYRALVSRRTVVTETACQALGDEACAFTVDWTSR